MDGIGFDGRIHWRTTPGPLLVLLKSRAVCIDVRYDVQFKAAGIWPSIRDWRSARCPSRTSRFQPGGESGTWTGAIGAPISHGGSSGRVRPTRCAPLCSSRRFQPGAVLWGRRGGPARSAVGGVGGGSVGRPPGARKCSAQSAAPDARRHAVLSEDLVRSAALVQR